MVKTEGGSRSCSPDVFLVYSAVCFFMLVCKLLHLIQCGFVYRLISPFPFPAKLELAVPIAIPN